MLRRNFFSIFSIPFFGIGKSVSALMASPIAILSEPIASATPITMTAAFKGISYAVRGNRIIGMFDDATKNWYDENEKLHRDDDLPAREYIDGTKEWFQHGLRHRDNDMPAMEHINGDKYWYQNGLLHRDNDLPAVEHHNGMKEWYQHGKIHRDNGPATKQIYYSQGKFKFVYAWYQNDKLHRDGGPAIENEDGSQHWYQHDQLHRDNGPASIYADGCCEWFQHGRLHRDNGPAVDNVPLGKPGHLYILHGQRINYAWYRHGGLYREDGPAIEFTNGDQHWYQGVLHRDNGPAVIRNGDQEWYQHGKCHREDGPAIISKNGDKQWYRNGKYYREDNLPAKECADGTQCWYDKDGALIRSIYNWSGVRVFG